MNKRLLTLKNMIDSGIIPHVIDATSISGYVNYARKDIPFHWGDIEDIGYGKTSRQADRDGDIIEISRHYTGPNVIYLIGHGEMKTGDWS
jgi:hypothetical protein